MLNKNDLLIFLTYMSDSEMKNKSQIKIDLNDVFDMSDNDVNIIIKKCLRKNYIELKNKKYYITELGNLVSFQLNEMINL